MKHKEVYVSKWDFNILTNCAMAKRLEEPVDWSARHVDSCGIAAEMLRPHSAQREEAQLRPAESEVPGTEINTPLPSRKKLFQTKVLYS
jgi:hypothetical protein